MTSDIPHIGPHIVPHIVIAVDGPAAAGKGTLSRRLGQHYGLNHLDTGLTYRATAKALIDRGLPLDDEEVAAETARALDLSNLDRSVLSAHEIGEAASKVAVMPKAERATGNRKTTAKLVDQLATAANAMPRLRSPIGNSSDI